MPASDWSDLCPQTIVVEHLLTRDAYGKPATFSAAQTFQGRRSFKKQRVQVPSEGKVVDVISTSQIWILGLPTLGQDDRVYVSGDTAPYPTVLSWDKPPDEDGEFFTKVYLGAF